MNKVAVWQAWRLWMDSRKWISIHEDWPSYYHCWVPSLPAAEMTLSPNYDIILQGHQPATWWQVDYTGPLTPWKEQLSILTSMDTLHTDFSFLHTMLLPKLLMYLQNALTTIMVSYIPLLLIKEFHPEQKKSGPMLMEFTGLIMLPTILKQLAW